MHVEKEEEKTETIKRAPDLERFKKHIHFYFGAKFSQGTLKGANDRECFLEKPVKKGVQLVKIPFTSMVTQLLPIPCVPGDPGADEFIKAWQEKFTPQAPHPMEISEQEYANVNHFIGDPEVWTWLLKGGYDVFSVL